MKPRKSSSTLHSFQDLKDLIGVKSRVPPKPQEPKPPVNKKMEDPELRTEDLFAKAMEGVTPIPRDTRGNYVEKAVQVRPPEGPGRREDAETLSKLTDLIRYGKGFNVCDTPEYIEGRDTMCLLPLPNGSTRGTIRSKPMSTFTVTMLRLPGKFSKSL
jgi:hypothetical protein